MSELLLLRAEGLSYGQLAKLYNISYGEAYYRVQKELKALTKELYDNSWWRATAP